MLVTRLLCIAQFVVVSHATAIQWGTCKETYNSSVRVDCGRLFVPMDYTSSDDETLSLELLRVPAKRQPAKSILLNFGGPGSEGRAPLAQLAPLLVLLSGGNYNLIAFDPRGTGATIPFECLETETEKAQFLNDVYMIPRVSDKLGLAHFWARASIIVNQCTRRQNKTGELLGTAFVARDLLSVAEALGEDGYLRYWGFSYGTTLGATFVSMFPDKIDKVILDGVQNPHEYYHAFADVEEWADSDEEFSELFRHCAQNPDYCALARNGVTASALEQSAWDLVERLNYQPAIIYDQILDGRTLRLAFMLSLYNPGTWSDFTTALDMLINGPQNDGFLTHFFHLDKNQKEIDEDLRESQSILGIHCGDRAARAGSLDRLLPTLEKMANNSKVMDGIPSLINLNCAQWRFEPKERYEGNFEVAPRKPVLIIGNTWDGLTPLRSAYNVSSGFEGSVLLEVHGHGHSSLHLPSACSLQAMNAYWENGTVPEAGTVCKVDAPPFSNITWDDVAREVGKTLTPGSSFKGFVSLEL